MIVDKSVNIQILGALMKEPLLLSDTKYNLTPDDFSSTFEKQIFGAIYNLYLNKIETITVVDIDNYLQNYEGVYQNFINHNGIEFLQDCEDISVNKNFEYYYNKLKKYNLLNDLQKDGFDISKIYPTDIMEKDYNDKMDKFEEMSMQDIVNEFKLKISTVESKYEANSVITTVKANKGITELLKRLQVAPDIGCPLQGTIYNTAVRGARLGKYYIRSADSGVGKSRTMVGDACGIAYPFRYNQNYQRWEYAGAAEKVLYVGTEQEYEEIQTMIIAYLTGLNEELILSNGLCNDEERKIISQACEIMDTFSDNLIICQIPDPDIKSVKAKIRQEVLQHDISYVFYDYIFSSPSLLAEFRDLRIREDVVLLMLSSALKDLAVELNIFLQSATQVTIGENERGKMKTKASIRGSKAIVDKADVGCIISLVTEDDLKVLSDAIDLIGIVPNQVIDIYKLRRGKYNNTRIWSYFDLGCCRRKDLFITDARMNGINNFKPLEMNVDFDNIKELDKILLKLNNNENNIEETKEFNQDTMNNTITVEHNITVNKDTGEVIKENLDWNDLI